MQLSGGCACGAIRFTISAPLMGVGACHCTDCQKASGGGPNYVALAPKDAFVVTKGVPKTYSTTAESGADAVRTFCTDCGTPLWSFAGNKPFIPVKLGALDDATDLAVGMHLFTASAPSWHAISENVPTFPKMPPMP